MQNLQKNANFAILIQGDVATGLDLASPKKDQKDMCASLRSPLSWDQLCFIQGSHRATLSQEEKTSVETFLTVCVTERYNIELLDPVIR